MQQLEFRLNIMMAERNIRTTTQLRRHLHARGFEMSEPQLGRYRNAPQSISLALLAALCAVLSCTPADLLRLKEGEAKTPTRPETNPDRSYPRQWLPRT